MPVRVDALAAIADRVVGLDDVDGPVVVACSGGPDSLTLLAVAVDRGLDPIAVHVDHGLRDGSAAEPAVVADAAERLGAGFDARQVDVAPGPNLEARARTARYAALGQAADSARRDRDPRRPHRGRSGRDRPARGAARQRGARARRHAGASRPCGAAPAAPPPGRHRSVRPRARLRRRCATRPTTTRRTGERGSATRCSRSSRPVRSATSSRSWRARPTCCATSPSTSTRWPGRPGLPSAGDAPAATLARLPRPLARRAVRCWLGAPPPSFDEVERVLAVAAGSARATELAGGRRVHRTGGQLVATVAGTGHEGRPN